MYSLLWSGVDGTAEQAVYDWGKLKMMRKLKRFFKKAGSRIALFFALPSMWISIVILVCAVTSIIISKNLYEQGNAFASSMYSNIFAGLITGFALSILSGSKAVYSAYLEERYAWLEETHTMLLDFINMHRGLMISTKLSDEEFSNKAYDTGAQANWVNQRVMQGTFDNTKWFDPPRYFLRRYDYDCMEMSKVLETFRESLSSVGSDETKRREDIELFRPIVNKLMGLNHDVLEDMNMIKIKIVSARKSII